jgi:hypothetical protein
MSMFSIGVSRVEPTHIDEAKGLKRINAVLFVHFHAVLPLTWTQCDLDFEDD